MNIVSYGGGLNSTALLVELVNRQIDVELVLFADTGGEKPHTYKYIKLFNKWLKSKGYPEITRVQSQDINGTYITLEQKCYEYHQLPSKAYGMSSCSEKHKARPQNKYMNNYDPAKAVWKSGGKVTKFIGFDADESHRVKNYDDDKYSVKYPLVEWEIGRDDCTHIIKAEGLELPGKSACFYCPSSKPHEIRELEKTYPNLMDRALRMERIANEQHTKVKGLGRQYSWADLLKNQTIDFEIDQCDSCYDG